jgi:hypothetical protein
MSLADLGPVTTHQHETEVEELQDRIAVLVAERQQLRTFGAGPSWLEQNRLQLGHSQRQLCYALIERHLPALLA